MWGEWLFKRLDLAVKLGDLQGVGEDGEPQILGVADAAEIRQLGAYRLAPPLDDELNQLGVEPGVRDKRLERRVYGHGDGLLADGLAQGKGPVVILTHLPPHR